MDAKVPSEVPLLFAHSLWWSSSEATLTPLNSASLPSPTVAPNIYIPNYYAVPHCPMSLSLITS